MTPIYENRDQAELAADKIRAFAQPQRLMILSLLLARGEQSVTELDQATGIGQPALSQQLAELRRADLVSTRRQAKQVYYTLADNSTALSVRAIEAIFGGDSVNAEWVKALGQPNEPSNDIAAGAAGFVRLVRS